MKTAPLITLVAVVGLAASGRWLVSDKTVAAGAGPSANALFSVARGRDTVGAVVRRARSSLNASARFLSPAPRKPSFSCILRSLPSSMMAIALLRTRADATPRFAN